MCCFCGEFRRSADSDESRNLEMEVVSPVVPPLSRRHISQFEQLENQSLKWLPRHSSSPGFGQIGRATS